MFDNSEKLYHDRLHQSLIKKTQHPFYGKVKSKIPYVILISFTFTELFRLTTYRIAGLSSAPFIYDTDFYKVFNTPYCNIFNVGNLYP